MRVHELAKVLKLDSKTLIPRLKELGIDAKSHMSSLNEVQAEEALKKLSIAAPKKSKTPKKSVKTVAVKKTPKKAVPQAGAKTMNKAVDKTAEEIPEVVSEQTTEEIRAEAPKETLIEKRLSRTVIRRRKKIEPVASPPEPAPQEPIVTEAKAEEEKKPSVEEEQVKVLKEAVAPKKVEKEEKVAKVKDAESPKAVKKVKLKEKESSPARIIDRIDLGLISSDKDTAVTADKDTAVTADKDTAVTADKDTAVTAGKKGEDSKAPADVTGAGGEADKKTGKIMPKRKKFRWQKEKISEEEQDRDSVPHKKIRYKVKEISAKGRKQKAEVIPFGRKKHLAKKVEKTIPKAIKRKIRIHEGITVADLAKRIGVKAAAVIKKLVELGVMATINQFLDIDTASLVAADFGYAIESITIEEEKIFEDQGKDSEKDLRPRCPVVTVMGHVDHGKTSLLDAIRNTNVTAGEKGGITQHIGAYRVSLEAGEIAFVDTPGHEAFTAMRARGAQVTDIVILVVAAEEGAKPQTIEAINHAKAANVPIIVAINKIDKPEADPEKVKQELSSHGLLQEEWGGDTIFVEVSAKKKQGIEKLLEMVLLQSEMLELKANWDKPAKGTILEARLDRGRGPIATVLIQEGTLKGGDSFVSRNNFGKVRALIDDKGRNVEEAGPSTPVEILGFSGVPESGDIFIAVDERKARQTSAYWQIKKREEELRKDARVSLENFLSTVEEGNSKELLVIIKADVQGSIEALRHALENLSTDEVRVNVIHSSSGSISLNDVMLASASNAIIIGFGVKTEPKVREAAELEKVDIRIYGIIYEMLDEVEKAMLGLLPPKVLEKFAGKAEIKQVFSISKYGTVAGCLVVEGKVVNGSKARVIRDSEIVYSGDITSLKRFKDDAKEAVAGQDCGIYLGNFKGFEVGDMIESFFVEEVERTVL